jgi:phage FluMu protein Com
MSQEWREFRCGNCGQLLCEYTEDATGGLRDRCRKCREKKVINLGNNLGNSSRELNSKNQRAVAPRRRV